MEGKASIINNMTEGPLLKQLVLFSIPVILGNVLQACYTIADMVVVGKFIGADGLSAVGIGGILQNLLLMVAMGLGFGGQILLSQQVGAEAHKSIKKTIDNFMAIFLISAVVFGASGVALTEWLLNVLNTPNVEGAAIATVVSQGIAFVASLAYLAGHKALFDFKPQNFSIDRKTVCLILKLSLPIIVYGLLMSVSSMFINSNVNEYGVAASAVDGIGNKLTIITNSVTMGLYTGGGAIIGQCFGTGKAHRIRSTFFLTIGLSLIVWAVLAVLLVALSTEIFRIFSSDTEVLRTARAYTLIASLMYLGMALATGPFALFEGVGNTTLEMVSGISENLVCKIIASTLLSHRFGLYGYWMGCAVATFVTPVVGFMYYFSGLWTKRTANIGA